MDARIVRVLAGWDLTGAQLAELVTAIEQAMAHPASLGREGISTLDPGSLDTLEAGPTDAADLTTEHPPTLHRDGAAETGAEGLPTSFGARYVELGLIGVGGMGEVHRVRDRQLNRVLAMKVLKPSLLGTPGAYARFVEEAQVSAQLQHPGIVPIHDFGKRPDGRAWFTMKEVRGRTLGDVIREVHAVSPSDGWKAGPTGWTFRRLVDALHRVSEAVAFAHSKGVVHRDLKPANVMVGHHGEVLVLDWGLAKVRGRRTLHPGDEVVATHRSEHGSFATRMGQVAGTPAYMPPEQARGEIDRVDARADVYALGAMLYQILSGRAPYQGPDGLDVLGQVVSGPPSPVAYRGRSSVSDVTWGSSEEGRGRPLPGELVVACERAMSREVEARFDSGADFAAELAAWLDGARRREQALKVVQAAYAHGPVAARLRGEAESLDAEAATQLAEVAAWEPEEKKAAAWSKQAEASSRRRQADREELLLEQGLHGALRIDATLPEAHAALAERYRSRHAVAESERDPDAVARAEALLRAHAESLPDRHETRQSCAAYLKGDGALTLVTDPPGAHVELHRFEQRGRRLVAEPVASLGPTPLVESSLEMGSYLCVVKHDGRVPVRYPVHIGRGEHWHGVPPEGGEPAPIYLPGLEELGEDDCYVPAGWFMAGGDPDAVDAIPRTRLWCDGLVMKRFAVTNREYIAFLDDLVAQGREEDALRWAPKERAGQQGEQGALIYGRRADGRFELVADTEGDTWKPDWPVFMVDWHCATAYARWSAAKTGLPWRVPREWEWEKSARGVGGRWYPWGDHADSSWCRIRDSQHGRPLPVSVETYPLDASVYGVRGMGGNVRDWCADVFAKDGSGLAGGRVAPPASFDEPHVSEGARRVHRGGHWHGSRLHARCAFRWANAASDRSAILGIRLLRSFPSAR